MSTQLSVFAEPYPGNRVFLGRIHVGEYVVMETPEGDERTMESLIAAIEKLRVRPRYSIRHPAGFWEFGGYAGKRAGWVERGTGRWWYDLQAAERTAAQLSDAGHEVTIVRLPDFDPDTITTRTVKARNSLRS